jgi:hypothetical protein
MGMAGVAPLGGPQSLQDVAAAGAVRAGKNQANPSLPPDVTSLSRPRCPAPESSTVIQRPTASPVART